MQKYSSNITTSSGSAVRGVPVYVFAEDGSIASLFSDRLGQLSLANPVITASDGTYSFYAANGRYSLQCTVEGVKYLASDVVLLFDPADSPDGAGLPPVATEAEAEDSTNALVRMFTPQRVWQATAKWWTGVSPTVATAAQGAKADTALQSETDPTVPAWAKAATKPSYDKTEVGLGDVDNTSDVNKPVSTAQQAALDLKAALSGGADANFAAMPQVGGSPIVESGSNANGGWTKWADGTMICYTISTVCFNQTTSALGLSGWVMCNISFVWPANFSQINTRIFGVWADSSGQNAALLLTPYSDASVSSAGSVWVHGQSGTIIGGYYVRAIGLGHWK